MAAQGQATEPPSSIATGVPPQGRKRLPSPCREKNIFAAQIQGKETRNKTGKILILFIEALPGIALRCPTAPGWVPHGGKRDPEKEDGVAGEVKELCAVASK